MLAISKLMSDAQRDRQQRFETLFADHYEAVLAYALRRVVRELAEEAAAETFTVAWRRFEDLPREPRPWLFGVARRVLADQRRSQRRRASLQTRLAAQPAPNPSSAGSVGVLPALARLREQDRELLLLVAWEGLEPAEAARALGISRIAVRVRLHRARKRLAAELDAESEQALAPPVAVELRVEEG